MSWLLILSRLKMKDILQNGFHSQMHLLANIYFASSFDRNMVSYAHSAKGFDELTLGENGWPPLQHRVLEIERSPDPQTHLPNFLGPDTGSFERNSQFETLLLPTFTGTMHDSDTLDPFPRVLNDMSFNFADPQLHEFYYDSGYTSAVPSPAPGELDGISGSAANNNHSPAESHSVPRPLETAFSTMQGNNDVAEIGGMICSLVADHLKHLSGLRTTQATTTPFATINAPPSAPGTKTSGRIHVDPQSHRSSHLYRKTQSEASSGLGRPERGRVTRYNTTKIRVKLNSHADDF